MNAAVLLSLICLWYLKTTSLPNLNNVKLLGTWDYSQAPFTNADWQNIDKS